MPVMPDTRITLSGMGDDTQQQSPFQTLGALMKIKESQQEYRIKQREAEQKQRDYEDNMAVRFALQQHPRTEDAMEQLRSDGRGTAAINLAENYYKAQNQQYLSQNAKLKLNQDQLGMVSQALAGVTDDASYQPVRKWGIEMATPMLGAQAATELFPTMYDKPKVDLITRMGTERTHQLQQDRDMAAEIDRTNQRKLEAWKAGQTTGPKGELSDEGLKINQGYRELLFRRLDATANQPEWENVLAQAEQQGVPPAIIQEARSVKYDADTVDPATGRPAPGMRAHRQAVMQGLDLKDRGALEGQQAANKSAANREYDANVTRIETERRQRAAEARAEEEARQKRIKFDQEQADRAAGGGAGAGKPLTPAGKLVEDARLKGEQAKTEKWLRDDSQYTQVAGTPGQGFYELLDPKTKEEYVRRSVETHNTKRKLVQSLPSMEDAAYAAKENNDREGYDKVVKEYAAVTNKAGNLEELIPWPERNAGVTAPKVQAARKKTGKELVTILDADDKNHTLTPAQRKDYEQQLADFRRGRR